MGRGLKVDPATLSREARPDDGFEPPLARMATVVGLQADNPFVRSLDAIDWPLRILNADWQVVAANASWRSVADEDGMANAAGGEGGLESCLRRARHALDDGAEVFEERFLLSNGGRTRVFILRVRRVSDPESEFVMTIDDITQITRAEIEIKRSAEEVQAVRELERRRIAMELHDSTGQQLVAIGLGLSRLRAVLGGASVAIDALDDLACNLAEAQRDIRTLSFLINPPGAEGADVSSALRAFAEGFARRAEVELRLDVQLPSDRLNSDDWHAAFRMVQEALVNVHRHSGATEVDVLARIRGGLVRCEVRDNGRGFPRRRLPGEGLHAMRSRMLELGGHLTIRNGAQGAVVIASWPLDRCLRRMDSRGELGLRVG